MDEPKVLWHQSGVNQDGEPFVQLILNKKVIAQMSPQEARDHAQTVIEAAESAEQDAFIVDFARTQVGLDFNRAGRLLIEFRKYRALKSNKKQGPTRKTDWVMPEE